MHAESASLEPSQATPVPEEGGTFQSMPREELAAYLRQIFAFFPEALPQRFSRMMLENILCPRGYWHDLDAPLVQEILIDLRDEGLVELVFRDESYVVLNPEGKTRARAQLGRFAPKV
jgi:hypothetical protein